ncbi:MAG: hypothetical protein KGJ87_09810 [Planctomycetota bacterium]|nr:hypothetical protein [Planctomycetota bacterium]MDE2217439.1 hypothetical protein [Planctomycetota bacterium]
MSKKTESTEKVTKERQKRILEAKKSFQKMQEEISPFIRYRRFKEFSTAGEWCETSSLYSG